MSKKRTVVAASVVGLAIAGMAGVAVAASGDGGPSGLSSRLEALVQDGTLTQAEADAAQQAREALQQQAQDRRAEHQADRQAELDELAGIIGISSDELVQRWRDGESLAEIAGDTAPEVEAWLTQHMTDRLADLEASIPDRVAAVMDGTGPGMGGLLGGGRGPHGGGGMGAGMGAGLGAGMGAGMGDWGGWGEDADADATSGSDTGA
jgi:hypothetical protein